MKPLLMIIMLVGGNFFPLQAAIHLKQGVTVDGEYVHLKDLFEGVPAAQQNKVIAKAPKPGKSQLFKARRLHKVARAYRLKWVGSVHASTLVQRSSEVFDQSQIAEAITPVLQTQIMQDDFKVDLDRKDFAIHLAKGSAAELKVLDCTLQKGRERFSARLQVCGAEGTATPFTVRGRVTPMVSVPVLNRIMKPGEIIQAKDLHMISFPAKQIQSGIVMSKDDIIGTKSKQGTLRENMPLRKTQLKHPLTIHKGELVTITAKSPFMELSTKGKALENGLKGEGIRILNISSNRVVYGTVQGRKHVSVELPTLQGVSS